MVSAKSRRISCGQAETNSRNPNAAQSNPARHAEHQESSFSYCAGNREAVVETQRCSSVLLLLNADTLSSRNTRTRSRLHNRSQQSSTFQPIKQRETEKRVGFWLAQSRIYELCLENSLASLAEVLIRPSAIQLKAWPCPQSAGLGCR